MNDKLLEQVSALADGELDAREAELLLARMARDPALRDAWERYHAAGEAMRGGLAQLRPDFAAGIAAAIEQEETPRRGRVAGRSVIGRLLQPVAGVAVAAAVAMVAVFTLQVPPLSVDRPMGEVVPRSDVVPVAMPRATTGMQQVGFSGVRSEALQNQLRGYLLNHSEHTPSPRIRGVMPYVQIAAHDTRRVDTSDADDRDPHD